MIRPPPTSTLFPYTTLFRSTLKPGRLSGVIIDKYSAIERTVYCFIPGRSLIDLATASMMTDRKSTRLNSSHANNSYAVFCLKKKSHTAATHEHAITALAPDV